MAAADVAVVEEKLGELGLDSSTDGGITKQSSDQSSPVAKSLRQQQLESKPLKTPIVDPAPSIQIPPRPKLTDAEEKKYFKFLETVKGWKEIPAGDGKGGPITDDEIMWLSRECLLRYLRATKWVVADAEQRLRATLTWRREYGVDKITGDYISVENETGKQLLLGYDLAGRPCQHMRPGKQNTEVSPRQIQHLVFMLERSIDLMPPGQETLALLVDFKAGKTRTNTSPGIGQGREVLNILQTHYPERLGRALVVNVPWVVWGFFKLITPFIDPATKEKLKFNEDMRKLVPSEQLWTEFQGDLEFEYDHATYWLAFLSLCQERFEEQRGRWEQAGKQYGESEIYMRGGEAASVRPSIAPPTEPIEQAGEHGPVAAIDNAKSEV